MATYKYKHLTLDDRITIQNEPDARQTWESCLMSTQEETAFLTGHLAPALDAYGVGDTRVLAWDHNKDKLVDRACEIMRHGDAADCLAGFAFHWYAGDHFEAVREVALAYPEKEILATEGCAEYSREWNSDTDKAEKYAHDIIGNINAGAHGYIDWNILLDESGGPNHVGNFCDAPVMYDRSDKSLHLKPAFLYIWHFSHFIQPGARRVLATTASDNPEVLCCANPDGTLALVALNRANASLLCNVHSDGYTAQFDLPERSIATLVWDSQTHA